MRLDARPCRSPYFSIVDGAAPSPSSHIPTMIMRAVSTGVRSGYGGPLETGNCPASAKRCVREVSLVARQPRRRANRSTHCDLRILRFLYFENFGIEGRERGSARTASPRLCAAGCSVAPRILFPPESVTRLCCQAAMATGCCHAGVRLLRRRLGAGALSLAATPHGAASSIAIIASSVASHRL